MEANPDAVLVAGGEGGLAGVLAAGIAPVRLAVLDLDGFDNSSDAGFLERLYIPGIRRAGDLQTAVEGSTGSIVIHNASERFSLAGPRILRKKLTAADIVALVQGAASRGVGRRGD